MTQWIAGQWVAGQGEAMTSVSPYDNQVVWQGDSATPAQVESAVAAAREAFLTWKKLSFAEREAIVLKFAEKVKENSEEIAQIIAKETGKPIWETRTEAGAMAGKIAISIRAYHDRTGESSREAAGNQIVLRHRPSRCNGRLWAIQLPRVIYLMVISCQHYLSGNTVVYSNHRSRHRGQVSSR